MNYGLSESDLVELEREEARMDAHGHVALPGDVPVQAVAEQQGVPGATQASTPVAAETGAGAASGVELAAASAVANSTENRPAGGDDSRSKSSNHSGSKVSNGSGGDGGGGGGGGVDGGDDSAPQSVFDDIDGPGLPTPAPGSSARRATSQPSRGGSLQELQFMGMVGEGFSDPPTPPDLDAAEAAELVTAPGSDAFGDDVFAPAPQLSPMTLEQRFVAARQEAQALLRSTTCYDLMPESSKMVVLDVDLRVKKAFQALVEHDVRSAPLYDSRRNCFIGMLTITDFIEILRKYYVSPLVRMEELEEHCISKWREVGSEFRPADIVSVPPTSSLLLAARTLQQFRIHRLPVIDHRTNNAPLFTVSYSRILEAMPESVSMNLNLDKIRLSDVPIGAFDHCVTILADTPVISVLHIFAQRRISAVPIVDEHGRLADVYSKNDISLLAQKRRYNNLDITVNHAIRFRSGFRRPYATCTRDEYLNVLVERIITRRLHRLICLDQDRQVIGVVSLSDIVRFYAAPLPGEIVEPVTVPTASPSPAPPRYTT